MLTFRHDERVFEVNYSSWRMAALLVLIPPALIYEYWAGLLDGGIENSELAGLLIGIGGSLAAVYYLLEFGAFRFSIDDDRFHWYWRNLLRRKQGEVPLGRVSRIRRDALESTNTVGLQYTYRLVVILDDGSTIPLSRGFSGVHDRLLGKIVARLRNFLGHVEPQR